MRDGPMKLLRRLSRLQTPVEGPPAYGRGQILSANWGIKATPFVILYFDYTTRHYVGRVWVHGRQRFFRPTRTVREEDARLADGFDHPSFYEARILAPDMLAADDLANRKASP